MLCSPSLNQEVQSAVSQNAIRKDNFQVSLQNQLGKALAAVGNAINIILMENLEEKNEILAIIGDSARILCDLHYNMSISRRYLILPMLDKLVKDVSLSSPVDELLFGKDLVEKIRSAKALEKSAVDIKARTILNNKPLQTQVKQRNLNSRGPLRSKGYP